MIEEIVLLQLGRFLLLLHLFSFLLDLPNHRFVRVVFGLLIKATVIFVVRLIDEVVIVLDNLGLSLSPVRCTH